jgi:hypothetical protein
MKKLNAVIYHKLLLQAEEAKEQKLTKLASGVLNALGPYPEEETVQYASSDMEEDVHRGLWSLATCVLKYHDVSSVDAEKLDEVIESLASKFINELEDSLGIEGSRIGPLEPAVPGESK